MDKTAKRIEIKLCQKRIDRLNAKMDAIYPRISLWTAEDRRAMQTAIERKWTLKCELEIEHCDAEAAQAALLARAEPAPLRQLRAHHEPAAEAALQAIAEALEVA